MITMVLHLFAAFLWVGGMFFAYMFLRPAAAEALDPPLRLNLWQGVFSRFFPWVWLSVFTLPITGYWMIFLQYGELLQAPHFVLAMATLGAIMGALFVILFFFPYRHFKRHIKTGAYPAAGEELVRIRRIIGVNLILGITVIFVVGIMQ